MTETPTPAATERLTIDGAGFMRRAVTQAKIMTVSHVVLGTAERIFESADVDEFDQPLTRTTMTEAICDGAMDAVAAAFLKARETDPTLDAGAFGLRMARRFHTAVEAGVEEAMAAEARQDAEATA